MTNAHYARPERAWANIPTIAPTTDKELAKLEREPDAETIQLVPQPCAPIPAPHVIRERNDQGQIAPTPYNNHAHFQLFAKCASQYGITVAQLRGRSNARAVVRARWLVMMALTRGGLSQPAISKALGGGKHASGVHYGLESAAIALTNDGQFAKAWVAISGDNIEVPEIPRWKQRDKKPLMSGQTLGAVLHNQNVIKSMLHEILRRLPA